MPGLALLECINSSVAPSLGVEPLSTLARGASLGPKSLLLWSEASLLSEVLRLCGTHSLCGGHTSQSGSTHQSVLHLSSQS